MGTLTEVRIYVKGDVVGVGFRAWTKIQAKMHGVSGWARNVFDRGDFFDAGGGVEIVFQGGEQEVKEMVELVKKGPPVSRVEETEVHWYEPKQILEGFEIRK